MVSVSQFSHSNSRRPHRLRRWLVGAAAITLVGFFGLLAVAQFIDDRLGCGSVDPTDPANYSELSILNDTAQTVRLDNCVGDYCRPDYLPASLGPGQRFSDNAACAASGADMTSWQVSAPDGRVLGYIAVNTPRKHDGLVFPVSHASADRTTPTRPT